MKQTITINEAELRNIIMNCVNEALQDESLLSRLSAGKSAAKDWVMGTGKFSDISNDYKFEKALDLFTNYRNLLTKANQMMNPAKRKAVSAFGAENGYAQAKDFARGGYQTPTPQPAPVSESVDEDFGGGVRAGFNKAMSNVKNGGVSNMFTGVRNAYSQGDAAGDVNNYAKAMTAANTAKKNFLDYCKANNINPQEVASRYDTNERGTVLHGDKYGNYGDRITARHAVQNSQINGKRGNLNANTLPSGAATAGVMQASSNWRNARNQKAAAINQNRNTLGGTFFEENEK